MFPVESLPPQYCEERAAAEDATRRLAQQQSAAVQAFAARGSTQPTTARPARPAPPSRSFSHVLSAPPSSSLSSPSLSRTSSSSVIGTIFHGFVTRKAAGTTPPPPASLPPAPSRYGTPSPDQERSLAELAARMAETKKDADICALPGWH